MAQETKNSRLDVPPSNYTVRVRMVDTTALMVLHSKTFVEPVMPGHEVVNAVDVAFLIENEHVGKRAMFDLGTRKDYWNLPPAIQSRFDRLAKGMQIPKDVKDILTEKDIPIESINDIIWSHSHWDHTGDTTLFPSSTNLVYGQGVSSSRPGYPTNPDSPLPENLFEKHTNSEIPFAEENGLTIGSLPAHDFYGDGSLYLLLTAGHAKGHICALARTTPDTFILMGGDACHFAGALRPNKAYPMPDPIPAGVLDDNDPSLPNPCPSSFFLDHHPQFQHEPPNPPPDNNEDDAYMTPKQAKQHILKQQQQRTQPHHTTRSTTPFYALSTDPHTVYDSPNPKVAQETVDKLITNFDAQPNVLVAIAHDGALLEHLPTLNSNPDADLNDWFAKGWKEKCYWGWLNEMPRNGRPGREMLVKGWWRDGVRYDTAEDMLRARV